MKTLIYILLFIGAYVQSVAQVKWVKYTETIPAHAVTGGYENGKDLWVGRAYYKDAWHPGKVLGGKCNIGWGGKEIVLNNFEILTNPTGIRLAWVTLDQALPENSIEGGKENGNPLFIGQATMNNGTVHPGKVFKTNGTYICNFGYGGNEVTEKTKFKVLVEVKADLSWIKYEGSIPTNAVAGGYENGQDLYVCRANYEGVDHPGKVVGEYCNIGWGGEEIVLDDFAILVNDHGAKLSWVAVVKTIPANAVWTGTENGKRLYVGQAMKLDNNTLHPGKVHLHSDETYICNYGYGGAEITALENFRVLVKD